VRGVRPDGYHELDTVFQTVDLWDTLTAEAGDELSLAVDGDRVPADGTNLVMQAAQRLQSAAGVRHGARLRLTKGIPVGGGMGGGSSDAAATLLLLDRLWRLDMCADALVKIARDLGADVPFFLVGGTASGRGRGDHVTPLDDAGELPLLLGIPPFPISTAEVYRRFDRARQPPPKGGADRLTLPENDVSVARLSTLKLPGGNDFGFVVNDLEDVVFEGWPELRAFRNAVLGAGASRAAVSGSGSTVFGIFHEHPSAERALSTLRPRYGAWELRLCRTIRGSVRVRASIEGRG
jgi:4-diphosphocytidyl-2-C-methyl-D-erythritol kinase